MILYCWEQLTIESLSQIKSKECISFKETDVKFNAFDRVLDVVNCCFDFVQLRLDIPCVDLEQGQVFGHYIDLPPIYFAEY